ncbi:hypothetical protein HYW82_02460 [Candidatus Peregrinibacteria bacterium]|nr:hypothetical protein [Candidatus Peregrinibacteria bacterium]
MSLKANYEFLFVGKDENSFLENYAYDLFQDHGDKSGQVFINMEVQNNPVDAEEIAETIYQTMQKVFFEDVDRDPYARFEAALKSVNKILAEFKSQKVSGYIGNLNVIIVVIIGNDLFLTASGDAEAYLIRKRYVSVVSEGLVDEENSNGEVFSSIASGKLESADFVLFSTTRLLRYIGRTDLAQCVNKKSVTESLSDVRDIIAPEILGRVGLTGILFSTVAEGEVGAIETGVDSMTRSILEADEISTSARRERLAGKFLSLFKRKRRAEVVRGKGNGLLSEIGGWVAKFWAGLFDGGFGKDKILALLVLVIVVLGIGVVWANNRQQERAEIDRLDKILLSVQDKVAEAETKGSYDKDLAKEILDKAYLDAKSVLDSGYYREKATLFLLKIEDTRDKLDNVVRVEDPVVVADLAAKRSDVNALGFANVGDRVFVYEYNALYEIVLDQVQDPLTVDDEEVVIAATGFDDRGSIVFLTKAGKLLEYKDGAVSFMDTDDGAFHKGVAVEDWGNKIYLLDAAGSQIWRYPFKGTLGKFGAAERYIAGEGVDLSGGQDVAIDSSVYVLAANGDILKFYGGVKQEFFINKMPFSGIKNPKVIYTNEKLSEIYVLDGKEARVFVFFKDATTGNLEYKAQYLFDGVGELRDLYVDADSKKLFVLSRSKVLEMGL